MENGEGKKSLIATNSTDVGIARRDALKRIAQKVGLLGAAAVVLEACGKLPGYSDYSDYSNYYSNHVYTNYTASYSNAVYTNYTVSYSNTVYTNYTVYST